MLKQRNARDDLPDLNGLLDNNREFSDSSNMAYTVRTSRTSDAPGALDQMRRNIMRDVQRVERESDQFLQRYAGNVGTPSNWPSYIQTAGQLARRPYETMRDYKDLENVLRQVRGHPDLAGYNQHEYDELRRVVERGKMFEYIEYTLKNDLVGAYEDRLDKFCVSFYHPSYGDDLQSVKEYEMNITGWKREIQERLDKVDADMDEVDKHVNNFPAYINNYGAVVTYMEESCQGLIGACQPMKKWLVADAQYPKRIQDEIGSYTRRKTDLREVIGTTEENRIKQEKKLRRAAAAKITYDKQLQAANDELRYLKRREQDVQESYVRAQAELQRKRKDLADVDEKRRIRKAETPSSYNYYEGMSDTLKMEIQALEEKIKTMVRQAEYLKVDQAKTERQVELLKYEVETTTGNQEAVTERMKKHGDELKMVNDDIQYREEKIGLLRKIREAKLQSQVLRKIQKDGYRPEKIVQVEDVIDDDMRTAFRITSQNIGRDWVWLYQQLPFDPPRDSAERTRDLEVIDLSHRRLDRGYDFLSMKSLEKWRRLSYMASPEELVRTLKKMKKNEIAAMIPLNGQTEG